MKHLLPFEGGADTGEATTDSIVPVVNGEDIAIATVNRPTEVLRARTETLRADAGYTAWARDADRALTYHLVGGTLTWTGAADPLDVNYGASYPTYPKGRLILSGAAKMLVAPMFGPGTARGEQAPSLSNVEDQVSVDWPSRFAYASAGTALDGIDFVSARHVFDGGNNITVAASSLSGNGPVQVIVNGNGAVADYAVQPGQDDIVVVFDPLNAANTIQHVIDAINAHPVASQLVTADLWDGANGASLAYAFSVELTNGLDSVVHEINDVNLAGFFNNDPGNLLREGDVLAIAYETIRVRRRSVEATGDHVVQAIQLINMSVERERAVNALPIGRVVDNVFVLTTGASMVQDSPRDNFYGGIAADISVDDTNFDVVVGTDVQAALDSIDDLILVATDAVEADVATLQTDLTGLRADVERGNAAAPTPGTGTGAERLGADASGFLHLATASDSQHEVNVDVDAKMVLLQAEVDAVEDVIADRFYLTVGPTRGQYASLEDAIEAINTGVLPHREIVILEDVTWSGSVAKGQNVTPPHGLLIRGEGRERTINVTNLTVPMFDLEGVDSFAMRDIRIVAYSFVSGGAVVLDDSVGTFRGALTLERVTLRDSGGSAAFAHLVNLGVRDNLDTGARGHLSCSDCSFDGQFTIAAATARASFTNCEFRNGQLSATPRCLWVKEAVETLAITGCVFQREYLGSTALDIDWGAAFPATAMISSCTFNDEVSSFGAAFDIKTSTSNRSIVLIDNCHVGAGDTQQGTRSYIDGNAHISNTRFAVPLKFDCGGATNGTIAGVTFDFPGVAGIWTATESYALDLSGSRDVTISGLEIYAPYSPSTFKALWLATCTRITITGLRILVNEGDAVFLANTNRINLQGFFLESIDLDDSDATRTGVKVGNVNTWVHVSNGTIKYFGIDHGYTITGYQTAFNEACFFSDIIIHQAAGIIGYSGTDNTGLIRHNDQSNVVNDADIIAGRT